jgi:hypothetical protein
MNFDPTITSLLFAVISGLIVLGYESLARMNLWPVGKLFQNIYFQLIFGLLSVLSVATYTWFYYSVWLAIGILATGFIVGGVTSMLLRDKVQWLALILILLSIILSV